MMQLITRFKRHITAVLAALTLAFGIAAVPSAVVSAGSAGAARDEVCQGVNLGGGTCNDDSDEIDNVIALVVNIFSIIAGVTAVIMLIIGGFKYVTSGGDSSSVASAKNTIIYALVGLVVIVLAQAAVRFILGRATA